jgi:hypothetical protein
MSNTLGVVLKNQEKTAGVILTYVVEEEREVPSLPSLQPFLPVASENSSGLISILLVGSLNSLEYPAPYLAPKRKCFPCLS